MTDLLQLPLTRALAWALVHFLWQGAVIGAAAAAILRVARLSPLARYALGVVALGSMLAAPAITCLWLLAPAAGVAPAAPAAAGLAATAMVPSALDVAPASTTSVGAPGVVWLLALWIAGVTFFSIRLIGGWVMTRRLLKRGVRPAVAEIQAMARRVAGRLALDRAVTVLESTTVAVPMLVGWVKPAVLMPVAAMAGLSPVQIEALLAHELAHVRRHDYLVNLLQAVVETLLFYHPAVWWLSRRVRVEREHCCDDLAVAVSDRLTYATALADLAVMAPARLALAATDGPLVARVRRILGQAPEERRAAPGSGWLAACFVVVMIGSLVPVSMASERQVAEKPQAAIAPADINLPIEQPSSVVPAVLPAPAPNQKPAVLETEREARISSEQAQEKERQPVQAALKRQLEELTKALQDARMRFEIGTGTRDQIREIETLIADLSARLTDLQLRESKYRTDADLKALDIEASRRNIERLKAMVEKGLASSRELDLAELDLKKQMLLLQRAKEEQNILDGKEYPDSAMRYKRAQSPEAAAVFEHVGKAMNDSEILGVLRDVEKLTDEGDRAFVLIGIAARQTMSPEVVSAYVKVARTIKSDELRKAVFAQPVRLR